MEKIVILSALFLLVFTCLICLTIWRKRGVAAAFSIFVLRSSTVGLLLYLAWLTLFDYNVVTTAPEDPSGARKLIVLHDFSDSMMFPAGDGKRADLANGVWTMIASKTKSRPYVDAHRILFAGNYVEDDRGHLLRTDATRLSNALTGALSRYRADAVMILSDGASNDGRPPQYLLDWARNRGVNLYAIGAGTSTENICDINIIDATCLPENPERITVTLTGRGLLPDRTLIRLSIDGQQIASRRIMVQEKMTLSFPVPAVENGWHEFVVEVVSPENEVCLMNNKRMGVFRRLDPQKILVLYGAPQIEIRHLTRFLRDMYTDRVEAVSVFSEINKELTSDDYVFCVIFNTEGKLKVGSGASAPSLSVDDKNGLFLIVNIMGARV